MSQAQPISEPVLISMHDPMIIHLDPGTIPVADPDVKGLTHSVYERKIDFVTGPNDYRKVVASCDIESYEVVLIEHMFLYKSDLIASVICHDERLFKELAPRNLEWSEDFITRESSPVFVKRVERKVRVNAFSGDTNNTCIGVKASWFNSSAKYNVKSCYFDVVLPTKTKTTATFFAIIACRPIKKGEEVFMYYTYVNPVTKTPARVHPATHDAYMKPLFHEDDDICEDESRIRTIVRRVLRMYFKTSTFKQVLFNQLTAVVGLHQMSPDTLMCSKRAMRYFDVTLERQLKDEASRRPLELVVKRLETLMENLRNDMDNSRPKSIPLPLF